MPKIDYETVSPAPQFDWLNSTLRGFMFIIIPALGLGTFSLFVSLHFSVFTGFQTKVCEQHGVEAEFFCKRVFDRHSAIFSDYIMA